jgi:hypothetical protein
MNPNQSKQFGKEKKNGGMGIVISMGLLFSAISFVVL